MVNATTQRACVWCALPMIALWMIGFWAFAGFLPPPAPSRDAADIARMFAEHRTAIRVGLLITAFGATLLAPFFGVLTVQLRRIEGSSSPIAYAQLALAALLIIEFIFPLYFLQAAAYRPERAASEIQSYHDVAWLLFVGVVSTAVLQFLLVGVAVLSDRRPEPILPRWFGYLTLWAALLFAPGGLCVFFQTGPFAWRGLFSWWIPLSAFGVWFVVATVLLLRVVDRQAREDGAPEIPAGPGAAPSLDRRVESLTAEVAALRRELDRLRAPAGGAPG